MKLNKKLLLTLFVPLALCSCAPKTNNVTSDSNGTVNTTIIEGDNNSNDVVDEPKTQEELEKEKEQIIEELTKPNSEKTVSEVESTAKSILTYEGSINNFTTLGSKGMLEVAVGEPNVDDIKNRVFEINLATLTYDNALGKLIDTSTIPLGSQCVIYAMDNTQTSAIIPVAIILNPTSNINYISMGEVEKFSIEDSNVVVIHDKFSSDLYYVDDTTDIISGLSEQPLLLDDVKTEDKLFILTDVHTKVENSDDGDSDSTAKLKELKSKTKYAKRIAVYREPQE